MSKVKTNVQKVIDNSTDTATDSIEAIMPITTKASGVVNRVASLDKAGVDHEVIALQMTKSSTHRNKYEKEEISTKVVAEAHNLISGRVSQIIPRRLRN